MMNILKILETLRADEQRYTDLAADARRLREYCERLAEPVIAKRAATIARAATNGNHERHTLRLSDNMIAVLRHLHEHGPTRKTGLPVRGRALAGTMGSLRRHRYIKRRADGAWALTASGRHLIPHKEVIRAHHGPLSEDRYAPRQ